MENKKDVKEKAESTIIIGGGPAGLSAAIYLARAGLNPLVFAGSPPGGQLMLTSQVENYPGFSSILGGELIEKMRSQAKKFDARIIDENVTKVDLTKNPFTISLGIQITQKNNTDYQKAEFFKTFYTKSILIATGAKALWLGLESETKLRGKGVSACATCDGFFFKGRTVAVIGGGDTAMEEALTLTKFANKVYLIHRRNQFRASKIMQARVFNNPKVKIIYNAVVEEILGEKKVEGVKLKLIDKQSANNQKISFETDSGAILDKSQTHSNIKLDGIFIAIGHQPDTDLFKGQLEMDEKGYIITTNRIARENFRTEFDNLTLKNLKAKIFNFNANYGFQTSIPGVFAAGDCVDREYRQAGTAAGAGIAAALEIKRWLENSLD